jgi:nucleoside 2-deoxyribosyltransferase
MKIYLAAPYAHPDPVTREMRVELVNRKAARLMEEGNLVFSPLSHSHPISKWCRIDSCSHNFWLKQDLWILEICDEMHIYCLEGWESSKGIAIEKAYAQKLNIPVKLISIDQ